MLCAIIQECTAAEVRQACFQIPFRVETAEKQRIVRNQRDEFDMVFAGHSMAGSNQPFAVLQPTKRRAEIFEKTGTLVMPETSKNYLA